MMLIKGKSKKRIITIALLGVFLASPMTGMCYAAEILPDSSRQESVIAEQVQEDIQKTIPAVPEVTAAGISAADKSDKSDINNINNINNSDLLYNIDNQNPVTVPKEERISLMPEDYAILAQEAQPEMNDEEILVAQHQTLNLRPPVQLSKAQNETGEMKVNSNNESVINANMSIYQKKEALKNLMEKYGYANYRIRDALEYIDWEKRKSTDFAPSFYTFLKKGHLTYFEDNFKVLYQYAFDEKAMKNISDLTDEIKKYGYDYYTIKYALQYIDWEKRKSTDFAPSFYTFLKKGHLTYFENNRKFLYQYAFDEQTMKNISDLTEEMKKHGYDESCIRDALAYIDWEKRKSTDFAPSFYTFLKKGYLEYFSNYCQFLYQYAFDEQAMKNISDLTEEMEKHGYDKSCFEYALQYIDWEKRKSTDFAPSFYTFLKKGHLTYFENNRKFLYQYAFDEQTMKNISDLTVEMEKYGYIRDALEYIDWEKRKSTDFAPSFYTFLKKGHLKYFEDNFKVLYQYAFDEQTMKNISDLTEEMKKYGYANYCIEYALAYIDWEKRKSTDFAPSFYTFLKKGHLKYFALYSKFLYQYAFDEQAMKNISDLTDEMIKHGYCEDCIEYALEYIDWEKRKSTDFAPSFYTFLKNGHLKYLDNNYKFLYQYAFDEQVMKNMLDLTEEMKKHGYDEDSIKMALAHIDWKKSENDFEHIINILKLNYAFLSVLEHMDYNKSAVTYEILKVMKNNRIGTNCISEHSKEIYAAYDKIYNNEKITNKEKKLAKELKKIENSYKRHQTISNTKDVIGFCGFILVAVVTLPIWAPIVLIALLTWDGSWH